VIDESQDAAAEVIAPTRPLYWSVRRELWENRFLHLAPLVVTAVVLFASLISTVYLPHKIRTLSALDPARRHAAVVAHFSMAPAPIMMTTLLIGLFYCLDALYGERRDRSMLFWKSLPVSDLTTVLSKASIPLLVLPLIAFALSVITQLIMLFASTAVLIINGVSPAALFAEFRFFQGPLVMLYGLTVHALWFAPIYGWLLLVSAWARRMPVLWATLPLLALGVVEKIAFGSSHFANLLKYRVIGAMGLAFATDPSHHGTGVLDQLSQLRPGAFLSAPGLWTGLIATAAFLAAAVRLRRDRQPI